MNQVKNEQRKTWQLRWGRVVICHQYGVSYFFFDAFLLVPGRIVFFDFWSSSTAWKCVKK